MMMDKDHEIHSQTTLPFQKTDDDDKEFKSLKGIAGRRLDLDEIRRERLKL